MPTPVRAAQRGGDEEIRPCGLCLRCVKVCPTGALMYRERMWSLDLGRCRFCQECAFVCPNTLISDKTAV